jgi:hypothetical protein
MENQPFLYAIGEQAMRLSCRSAVSLTLDFGGPYRVDAWRIGVTKADGHWLRLPLPEVIDGAQVAVECNPHLFEANGQMFFGYVAGLHRGPGTPIVYRYAMMPTTDVQEFGPIILGERGFSACKVGTDFYRVKKTTAGDVLLCNGVVRSLPMVVHNIYRVVPVFGQADKLLLTVEADGADRSWLMEGIEATEVRNAAGNPVYKCSLLEHDGQRHLAYTVKGPNGARTVVTEITAL